MASSENGQERAQPDRSPTIVDVPIRLVRWAVNVRSCRKPQGTWGQSRCLKAKAQCEPVGERH